MTLLYIMSKELIERINDWDTPAETQITRELKDATIILSPQELLREQNNKMGI